MSVQKITKYFLILKQSVLVTCGWQHIYYNLPNNQSISVFVMIIVMCTSIENDEQGTPSISTNDDL